MKNTAHLSLTLDCRLKIPLSGTFVGLGACDVLVGSHHERRSGDFVRKGSADRRPINTPTVGAVATLDAPQRSTARAIFSHNDRSYTMSDARYSG